jgi:CubicO group peptidase (beta-lactamase class C family)
MDGARRLRCYPTAVNRDRTSRPAPARWLLAAALLTACSPPSDPVGGAPSAPTAEGPAVEPTAPAREAETNALAASVDAALSNAAASDRFAGSVIVVDGGKEVLAKGYGEANRATQAKNTADTVFCIGSVSKGFTAAAVLALADDGRLKLTDKVAGFFPEVAPATFAEGGVDVTVHHLLSQSSGLPDPASTDAFRKAVWFRPIRPTEQLEWARGLPMVATPGSRYRYLNYNYLLAALVVERVSGRPFEQFLRERLLDPTGVNASTSARGTDDAVGYRRTGSKLTTLNDDPRFTDRDLTFAFGAGQLRTTVRDLARWDRALARGAVLTRASREVMVRPNLEGYGYGWIAERRRGTTVVWHNGALSPLGFSALVVRVPDKDRFVAYLANRDIDEVEPLEAKILDLAAAP